MGGRVDAPGHPAHHRPSGPGDGLPVLLRQALAVGGAGAGAHHRHRLGPRPGGAPPPEQEQRRLGNAQEFFGKARVVRQQQFQTGLLQLPQAMRGGDLRRPPGRLRNPHLAALDGGQNRGRGAARPVRHLPQPQRVHAHMRQTYPRFPNLLRRHHAPRKTRASARCGSSTASDSARSAMVRDSRRTRSKPRPVREPERNASSASRRAPSPISS